MVIINQRLRWWPNMKLLFLILLINITHADNTVPQTTVIRDFKPIVGIKTITEILK
jgi:hypothetical protein